MRNDYKTTLAKYGYKISALESYTTAHVEDGFGAGMRILLDTGDTMMNQYPNNVVELVIFQRSGSPAIKYMALDELIAIGKMAEAVKENYEKKKIKNDLE